jgi:hypothetical protein
MSEENSEPIAGNSPPQTEEERRAAARARGLANLRPWKKGQPSANPGGRPKGLASKIREMTGNGADLLEFYRKVWQGELKGFSGRDRLEAAKRLEERGWGKSPEVTLTGELDSEALEAAKDLTTEELRVLASAVKDDTEAA